MAINKQGVIRGNYYNALTDSTTPIYGSADKTSQRAAWTVGDKKTPVYEAGIANLTKDETTMLVHFGEGKSQQLTLVRVEKPEGEEVRTASEPDRPPAGAWKSPDRTPSLQWHLSVGDSSCSDGLLQV